MIICVIFLDCQSPLDAYFLDWVAEAAATIATIVVG
jgi:hypothetical protein